MHEDWESLRTPENIQRGEEIKQAMENESRAKGSQARFAYRTHMGWENKLGIARMILFPRTPVEISAVLEVSGGQVERHRSFWVRGRCHTGQEGLFVEVLFAPIMHDLAIEDIN